MRFLDRVGEGNTFDRIYLENLFEQLETIDGVTRISILLAIGYIEELIAGVTTECRGASSEVGPLISALEEILDAMRRDEAYAAKQKHATDSLCGRWEEVRGMGGMFRSPCIDLPAIEYSIESSRMHSGVA